MKKMVQNFYSLMLHKNRHLSGDQNPVVNTDCSEFEVNNWIISDFIVKVLVPLVGTRPFPIHEQLLLVATICRFSPSHIFEWGTNIGKSARIFYETSRYFKIPTYIHSVDLPDSISHLEHPGSQRGMLVRGLQNITLYQGDGLTKSFEVINNLGNINKPVFFLDGDHSYDSVFREISEITQKIRDPVIIVHDTFYQSSASHYNVGPHKAIHDVIMNSSEKYSVIEMNTGLPGMTVIFNRSIID